MSATNESRSQNQNQGNIRSPKRKQPGKLWSEEDMEKAEPYPIQVLPGDSQKTRDNKRKKQEYSR